MKHKFPATLALLAAVVLLVPGCSKPIPADVQNITQAAVSIGFGAYAAKNKDQAAKVAGQVTQGATEALAYLQGNQGVATTVLNATVLAKLTGGLPADIQLVIKAAAGILDTVLPAPKPDSFLDPNQLEYLVAFLQGVKDGCAGTKAVVSKDITNKATKLLANKKPGKWLN